MEGVRLALLEWIVKVNHRLRSVVEEIKILQDHILPAIEVLVSALMVGVVCLDRLPPMDSLTLDYLKDVLEFCRRKGVVERDEVGCYRVKDLAGVLETVNEYVSSKIDLILSELNELKRERFHWETTLPHLYV